MLILTQTDPVTTNLATTNPVTTDPITTDTVTTDPVTTDPVTTNPVTTDFVTSDPVTVRAATVTDANDVVITTNAVGISSTDIVSVTADAFDVDAVVGAHNSEEEDMDSVVVPLLTSDKCEIDVINARSSDPALQRCRICRLPERTGTLVPLQRIYHASRQEDGRHCYMLFSTRPPSQHTTSSVSRGSIDRRFVCTASM